MRRQRRVRYGRQRRANGHPFVTVPRAGLDDGAVDGAGGTHLEFRNTAAFAERRARHFWLVIGGDAATRRFVYDVRN